MYLITDNLNCTLIYKLRNGKIVLDIGWCGYDPDECGWSISDRELCKRLTDTVYSHHLAKQVSDSFGANAKFQLETLMRFSLRVQQIP